MRPYSLLGAAVLSLGLALPLLAQSTAEAPEAPQLSKSTTDHSKLKPLQKQFTSGPEVTAACITCHTEADDQAMHAIHFTWEFTQPETGQMLGKRHVVNSFCGNVAGNEARCTSCHAGYGWEDMSQPPPQQSTAVDCLVCHDRSGQYTKTADDAGFPPLAPVAKGTKTITGADAWPVDLTKAAQSVGMPGRDNCGNCHFYGGGGDNVKHGDLSSALYEPAREVDVHMSADGANFTCSACHVADRHSWAGSRYAVTVSREDAPHKPGAPRDIASCESCHSSDPHPASLMGLKLNDHTDTLACQSCHIPEFARGGVATKTFWDWSQAGKLKDGKPYHEEDFIQSDGKHLHSYLSTKGDFKWEENAKPIYAWFDGQVEYTTADRTIDSTKTVEVNILHGDPEDGRSRIWPFKRMEGRQAYDSELNRLVYTHVWGPTTDTALWTNFDWPKAIEAGMKAAGAEYSGSYDFVDTYMYWPITHMVAPAEKALECESCHAPDGRMSNLAGVFLPGTNPNGLIAILGKLLVLATLAGVLAHIAIRIFSGKKGGPDV
ncbi:tetrathionate reductase family octaheme c-type cytochrome [Vannielia sp.]|uniref:tetrathionate reductase family octaheme c-type cytochrome n=1 Tax=Vannielia sp. TaxID=2813045 RepID=UPI00261CE389|nr:tetrathionate reductase family octaheme c-type cytochrome [Vannielia sp.]MDF1871159.1 tetrathionate reductase family octaheme c-type cytochrome [Vannielia sp.]